MTKEEMNKVIEEAETDRKYWKNNDPIAVSEKVFTNLLTLSKDLVEENLGLKKLLTNLKIATHTHRYSNSKTLKELIKAVYPEGSI